MKLKKLFVVSLLLTSLAFSQENGENQLTNTEAAEKSNLGLEIVSNTEGGASLLKRFSEGQLFKIGNRYFEIGAEGELTGGVFTVKTSSVSPEDERLYGVEACGEFNLDGSVNLLGGITDQIEIGPATRIQNSNFLNIIPAGIMGASNINLQLGGNVKINLGDGKTFGVKVLNNLMYLRGAISHSALGNELTPNMTNSMVENQVPLNLEITYEEPNSKLRSVSLVVGWSNDPINNNLYATSIGAKAEFGGCSISAGYNYNGSHNAFTNPSMVSNMNIPKEHASFKVVIPLNGNSNSRTNH